MNTLLPLESLYDMERDSDLLLPPDLAALYGRLQFPLHPGRPYVIGNFVSTLDGVVTLNAPGQSGGGPISGFNPHDHLVMGLLRAVADAVIVGAGTLRAVSLITAGRLHTFTRRLPQCTSASVRPWRKRSSRSTSLSLHEVRSTWRSHCFNPVT